MEDWVFDGGVYEVVSFYSLTDDAWTYELTGPAGSSATAPGLVVIIPDATPDDGPFTASPSASVRVLTADGTLPWRMLSRFLNLIESSGDLTTTSAGPVVTGDLHLSHNELAFADRRYEVNSYSFSDCWRYELYQSVPALTQNDFIDVTVPEPSPDDQPSAPLSADLAVLRSHGRCDIPWPIFRRFLDLVSTDEQLSGDSPPPAEAT